MTAIVLQFSDRSTVGAWMIRRFTWSPYSHVDIVLPDGRLLGARLDGGVQVRDPEAFTRVARFDVPAPDSVLDAAMDQVGRPYDWAAILGIVARRDWQDRRAWFCSELVAWAFRQGGRPLLRDAPLHRVTPRDLLMSPYLVPTE